MATSIYSLSISARLTLDMHSLNNEGSEGNQLQTRMVDIVAADGRLYSVNAISGDMLKHIQAEHLYHIAQGDADAASLHGMPGVRCQPHRRRQRIHGTNSGAQRRRGD